MRLSECVLDDLLLLDVLVFVQFEFCCVVGSSGLCAG